MCSRMIRAGSVSDYTTWTLVNFKILKIKTEPCDSQSDTTVRLAKETRLFQNTRHVRSRMIRAGSVSDYTTWTLVNFKNWKLKQNRATRKVIQPCDSQRGTRSDSGRSTRLRLAALNGFNNYSPLTLRREIQTPDFPCLLLNATG